MEIYNKINIIVKLADTATILQPMDQGVILTLKSYYLRSTFCKALATIDSHSFNGSGKSKQKTLWKGFTILDAIKYICDSWEEAKISTLIGVWKKLISIFMDDFKSLKISMVEVTEVVMEIARDQEFEVEPEDVTDLLQSHDKF